MMERVAENLKKEKLSALDVKDKYFPVRQIILAGDDVCFVAEGRIGLEAARIFVEKLAEKTNSQDGRGYAACAGVAIVHQKYPFYKAYELAEMLCSNAKKYIASLADGQSDTGSGACAIDWHVEFGEIADTLGRMREKYITADNKTLELRPYLLSAEKDIWEKERLRRYENFRSLITALQSEKIAYARSKIKELREALKEGEAASGYYLRSKLISELELIGYEGIFRDLDYSGVFKGEGLERRTFVETTDGKERSLYFDAVELLDTFVELD